MSNEQLLEQFDHFVDSHHGIYSAQVFAEKLDLLYQAGKVEGIDLEGWNILKDGPDNADFIDVWANELQNVVITDDNGKRWLVWENEGIFLYPEEIHDLVNWEELSF